MEMHEVVSKLTERTEQGRIPWKKGVGKTSFIAVFGNLSVLISARTGGIRNEIMLSVLDEYGDEIERAKGNRFSEDPQSVQLDALYWMAKQKAMGPDPRLEELVARIDARAPVSSP